MNEQLQIPQQPQSIDPALKAQLDAIQQQTPEVNNSGGQQIDIAIDGDPGIMDYVQDTALSVVGGVAGAVNETRDFIQGTAQFAKDVATEGWDAAEFREPTAEEGAFLRIPEYEPETGVGAFVKGMTQFAAGFVGGGKFLKGAKLLQGKKYIRPMAQGAFADTLAFDAQEQNVSALIQEIPWLRNPINEFLTAKESDHMSGRLKNLIEGVGLGLVADKIVDGLRFAKRSMGAKTEKELAKISSEYLDKYGKEEGIATSVNLKVEAPVKASTKVPIKETTKAPERLGVDAVSDAATHTTPPVIKEPYRMAEILRSAKNSQEAFREVTKEVNLAREVYENPEMSHVVRGIADMVYDSTLKGKGVKHQTQWLTEATEEAERFGFRRTEFLNMGEAAPEVMEHITRFMTQQRAANYYAGVEMNRLKTKIDAGHYSTSELARWVQLQEAAQEMRINDRNLGTGSGRMLDLRRVTMDELTASNILGVKNGDEFATKFFGTFREMSEKEAEDYIKGKGWKSPDEVLDMVKKVQGVGDDPYLAMRLAQAVRPGRGFWDVFNSYRIWNLLSSPVTWGYNLGSNVLKTTTMPFEKALGGAMRATYFAATGSTEAQREAVQAMKIGLRTYGAMYQNVTDAFRMAGKAFIIRDNILDASHNVLDGVKPQGFSYNTIKDMLLKDAPEGSILTPMQEVWARGLGALDEVLGISTRFMVSTDEFFKQLNYRSDLTAKYTQKALDAGMESKDVLEYVQRNMAASINKEGEAMLKVLDGAGNKVANPLAENALLTAQRSTWTQDLGEGTFAKSLYDMANNHAGAKFVLPFVRTPMNIFRDFTAHFPGMAQLFSHDYKVMMKGTAEDAARAQGQLALGGLTLFIGSSLAYNGHITGSPPEDPILRMMLEATGWQPYSIKIGDKYYSYSRLDPLGMFLGYCADMMDVYANLTEDDNIPKELMFGFARTMVNNALSKTYLQGLTEVIETVNDPERYMETFAGRTAATFVPASSALRLARKIGDPHMREMQDFMDYVKNTIPGLSKDLPAKRNWVNGEIEDYRFIGQDKGDWILNELYHLGEAVDGAPQKDIQGVKLTAVQYADLCELHGTVEIKGKTMTDALETLFDSREYDYEREQHRDGINGMDTPRTMAVNQVIQGYRKEAIRQLMDKHPDLYDSILNQEAEKALTKAGKLTEDNRSDKNDMIEQLLKR